MMEPRFERARVLAEALDVGVRALEDPIDNLTVTGNAILIAAGRNRIELSYVYNNAYASNGAVKPGSGHWSVCIVGSSKENWLAAAVRAIFEKVGFFKGRRRR